MNLHHYFWRQYSNAEGENERIVQWQIPKETDTVLDQMKTIPRVRQFDMETTYPGLIAGLGYPHGKTGEKDESYIETGFSFDYATGVPVIPGSSVKGALRAAFRSDPEYVQEKLTNMGVELDVLEVYTTLQKEIFAPERPLQEHDCFFDALPLFAEGIAPMKVDNITPHITTGKLPPSCGSQSQESSGPVQQKSAESRSMPATEKKAAAAPRKAAKPTQAPTDAPKPKPGGKKAGGPSPAMFANRARPTSISQTSGKTPTANPASKMVPKPETAMAHVVRANATKDPNPVTILKVGAEVIFRFTFLLHDTTIARKNKSRVVVTAKHKEKLFKRILEDFGVGAKTNVGYGHLVPVPTKES